MPLLYKLNLGDALRQASATVALCESSIDTAFVRVVDALQEVSEHHATNLESGIGFAIIGFRKAAYDLNLQKTLNNCAARIDFSMKFGNSFPNDSIHSRLRA